jgi:hypothetical protein
MVSVTSRCFTPKERVSVTNWTGGWVGPRGDPDAEKEKSLLLLPGIEPQLSGWLASNLVTILVSTNVNSLMESSFCMQNLLCYKETVSFSQNVFMVLYHSRNKQRLFACAALTSWSFLMEKHCVSSEVGTYILTYLLTELSPSWEAANCAATQELPSILWNPKVHHRVHKSPSEVGTKFLNSV